MLEGFFDIHFRLEKIEKHGDPLVVLNNAVDWEIFRKDLDTAIEAARFKARGGPKKSDVGRPPFDNVLMFKVLILQSLYNLSDAGTEEMILDRLSFMRFLGISMSDPVPDEKTIWLFRQQLTETKAIRALFGRFDRYLRENGFEARKGQIVDASIVSRPQPRNTREENQQLKEGKEPKDWNEAKRRQKDKDARWTVRNRRKVFGYKNHIQIDVKHKIIRNWEVTHAAIHDSRVFDVLLDEKNSSRSVWADSAYGSKESIMRITSRGFVDRLHKKGCKNRQLTSRERKTNRRRSRTRCRIEHVFGVMAQRAGDLVIRTVGIVRAASKIGLRNLTYNLDRYANLATLG